MPTCTVNGVEVTVPDGATVLQAAEAAGFTVPTFCYHEGLSSPANCRMCTVDLGRGHLGPACYTWATEGGAYRTDTEAVVAFQKANLEFILVNHPVDCPICDQSGECDLQDLYYRFSRRPSRLRVGKVAKAKAVQIGPDVMYDAERCINCTRCVRVCEEVAGQPQLVQINRGDHTEIATFPGQSLDHAYSLCCVDVCPVGALTSRDFRFRARAWYLTSTPTVCPGCATGCNVHLDHADGVVRRLRPRYNPDVNRWWMCDEGRFTYARVHQDRLLRPRTLVDGESIDTDWTDALSRAAERLSLTVEAQGGGAIAVVASPWCTNEDLFVLGRFAAECLETRSVYLAGHPDGEADDVLRSSDRNPNAAGARAVLSAFGIELRGFDRLLEDLRSEGKIAAVYQVGGELPADGGLLGEAVLLASETWRMVVQADQDGLAVEKAQVALPTAAWAEVDGTWLNRDGRVQRVTAAVPAKGEARPHWETTMLLAQRLGYELEYAGWREVFSDLAARVPGLAGLTAADLGPDGVLAAGGREGATP